MDMSPAFAQVPSSAEPSRAKNQITPIEQAVSPDIVNNVTSGPVIIEAPKGAEKVKFTLKSVNVTGDSVYSDAQLSQIWSDKIGQTITLADVYGFAQELTVKYRNDGYILTQVVVPEQTISGGNVTLRVVEGFVDKVTIQGTTRSNIGYLQGFAENLRAERPLNAKTLERYVLIMNDLAGMNTRAVLTPSATVAGASDVTLIVGQKSYDFFGQVDNRGSRYLGPIQLNAGMRINNPTGLFDSVSLQYVRDPAHHEMDSELDYFALSYSVPLNYYGTKLTVGGGITSTQPGYTLDPLDVHGNAKTVSIEVSHPVMRTRNESLYVALKYNYLNSYRKDNVSAAPVEDRLSVFRLAGTYQLTDRFVGINTINLELSKGMKFLASDKGDANMTRALGDPQFFKATLEISRLQRLTSMFDLYGSVTGQTTPDTLLASEEFGVGGVNYGSAYDSSEITGEKGVAGRLELRANNPIETPLRLMQLYGFYDAGKVWDTDNATPADRERSLTDTGMGVRANFNDNFAGTFEAALPLTRDVATQGDRDLRFFGSLTAKF